MNRDRHHPVLNRMAEPTGLEPATSDVTGRRSNQLNLRLRAETSIFAQRSGVLAAPSVSGGRYWIRTSDPRFVRPMLYR